MSHYPVFLELRDRRCVVLGDGELADEKAATLRAAGADVVHLRRPCAPGDLRGAYLAIEASGDPAAQEVARREADEHHVLLNVVDVTDKCDWIAPAVVRRGPLQIAISTGGESPFLASTLRARLERLFGEEWGPFTQVVGTVRRRLRRRGVSADQQRIAYRRLLRSPARALLREGRYTDATDLAASIERDARGDSTDAIGEVVLVGAGPG
ncbi:MAG: precorrin-2 dehydrogenase/sirohydrochlorin ferrochelatase family protein, partial [Candidatus Dormibacteria bacterium]